MNNSFTSTLLNLEDHPVTTTHWSRSVYQSFTRGIGELPYYQSQIMESSVLIELAALTKTPLLDIESLSYESSGQLRKLQKTIKNKADLSASEQIGLSCALSSISRFNLAMNALEDLRLGDLDAEEKIHFLLQRFAVKNRLSEAVNCELEFRIIKEILSTATLPTRYVLKCAAPAIVWKNKANVISTGLHAWFVNAGLSAVKKLGKSEEFLDQIAISNFYRAHAMIPAARKDLQVTRREMMISKEYSEHSTPKNALEESMRLDSIKTVHESEIKEHLYVSGDLDRAEVAAEALIRIDPNWPISYHEAAEVALKQGNCRKALKYFESANQLGPPRITFSQFMIGACHEALGNTAEALHAYTETLKLDDTNVSAAVNAHNLSKKIGAPSVNFFRRFINEWSEQGLLDPAFLKENLL